MYELITTLHMKTPNDNYNNLAALNKSKFQGVDRTSMVLIATVFVLCAKVGCAEVCCCVRTFTDVHVHQA